jgi:hypothetical protein
LLSKSWANLPGATATITVPSNTQAVVDVRFSGAGTARTTTRLACSGS